MGFFSIDHDDSAQIYIFMHVVVYLANPHLDPRAAVNWVIEVADVDCPNRNANNSDNLDGKRKSISKAVGALAAMIMKQKKLHNKPFQMFYLGKLLPKFIKLLL